MFANVHCDRLAEESTARTVLAEKAPALQLSVFFCQSVQNMGGDEISDAAGRLCGAEQGACHGGKLLGPASRRILYVDSHTQNGVGQTAALHVQARLCQNSAHLLAAAKDVVYPLDRGICFRRGFYGPGNAYRGERCNKQRLLRGKNGTQKHAHV